MPRFLKWTLTGISVFAGLLIMAVVILWVGGNEIAAKRFAISGPAFVADPATADVDEGRRLAITRGCFGGCHGQALEGKLFVEEILFGYFNAPDLTRVFAERSDEEIERIVRQGIFPDGSSTFLMPSAGFHHLTDGDLNNIFAFIRSQPRSDGPQPRTWRGPMANYMIMTGDFPFQAQQIESDGPFLAADDENYIGKYIALSVCAECHGMDFEGFPDFSPSLTAIAAYSEDDFHRLMNEGIAVGDRQLDLMATVATKRFVHLTDHEELQLYSFLLTLVD